MSQCIREYNPKRIKRMCFVYGDGRVAQSVKKAVGCDDIMNASFYGTYRDYPGGPTYKKPVFHLKSDGNEVYDPQWTNWGASWKTPSETQALDFGIKRVRNDTDDSWISGFRLMDPEQDVSDPLDTAIPSYNTKRGRTLLGVKADGTIVAYVCGDGTSHALTAKGCRDKMVELGCQYAIMLDGGGSSQCDFADGNYIRSVRPVCDYLCIWLYTDEEMAEMEGGESEDKPVYQTFYRVQVGAFSKKTNADNYLETMKTLGYDDAYVTKVTQENGTVLYKVQIGSFSVYDNAVRLKNELAEKNISAFIAKVQIEKK